MKCFKITLLLAVLLLIPAISGASAYKAWDIYKTTHGDIKYYPRVASELMAEGLSFAALPFIKEYLMSVPRMAHSQIDNLIDESIAGVGIKQYEVLPVEVLNKTNAPTVKYILAKKLFRLGKYEDALRELTNSIPDRHPISPFALMLKASIYNVGKRYDMAVAAYKDCVSNSEKEIDRVKNPDAKRQLQINRDYCLVGVSRTQFAAAKFNDAEMSYLDLPKSSYVWPEILFEEAWNSFYKRDYNRTLGKLVTYRAPVLDFIFNPEIEVLKAFAYMEMCLWADVGLTVEDYYRRYQKPSEDIERLVRGNKDYKTFYNMAKGRKDGELNLDSVLNQMLKAITRDPAYIEMDSAFWRGREEIVKVENLDIKEFRKILGQNLKHSLTLQRDLIGAYVRKSIQLYLAQIKKSLEGMSYIKLEVLSRKRSELLSPPKVTERGRGDERYIQRNDKQYFWTFNGEFWADELGDYVFALSSECKE
jgi:tetratricopeptide (TPR) repeat protein